MTAWQFKQVNNNITKSKSNELQKPDRKGVFSNGADN